MELKRFDLDELDRAVDDSGGREAVVGRLAARYGDNEAARKLLDRALERSCLPPGRRPGVGAELAARVLSALEVPKDRLARVLPGTAPPPETDPAGGQAGPGRGFEVTAEVEATPGGSAEEVDGHGTVHVGGCQLLVGLSNLTARPLTVTAVGCEVAWAPVTAKAPGGR
ncbi:MAG: hypothetical protein K2X82_07015 [Gemmataceae bacterium]|nr:hypothetical protein [Gemmataceae bacterium]